MAWFDAKYFAGKYNRSLQWVYHLAKIKKVKKKGYKGRYLFCEESFANLWEKPKPQKSDGYLSVRQFAKKLQLNPSQVYFLIKSRKIPSKRINGIIMVPEDTYPDSLETRKPKRRACFHSPYFGKSLS